MIINPNEEIRKFLSLGDKIAEKVTNMAGSSWFLALNTIWFIVWLTVNTGVFGKDVIFDGFPFGFLTLVVSLEAIFLSIFVLITQNRQSKVSDIRGELDYRVNLQTESDIDVILSILERLAVAQNIEVADLMKQVTAGRRKVTREHPVDESGGE
ncbi:MAG: hypothetical protein JWN38_86 [Candidatus Saccharibacteria bacterium]|nr:hypothetical protein [Candidatus Saccharibacteria bacterium]